MAGKEENRKNCLVRSVGTLKIHIFTNGGNIYEKVSFLDSYNFNGSHDGDYCVCTKYPGTH
jgi:hypothetical protein